MAGNVWEWCLNEYSDPSHVDTSGEAPRVVPGSWYRDQGYARAAYRFNPHPGYRLYNGGFRVVGVVPSQ